MSIAPFLPQDPFSVLLSAGAPLCLICPFLSFMICADFWALPTLVLILDGTAQVQDRFSSQRTGPSSLEVGRAAIHKYYNLIFPLNACVVGDFEYEGVYCTLSFYLSPAPAYWGGPSDSFRQISWPGRKADHQ